MGYCYVCDRCGKLIPDTVFTVGIGAESVHGGNSIESTAFNLSQILSPDKKFCRGCVDLMMELMRPVKSGENDT